MISPPHLNKALQNVLIGDVQNAWIKNRASFIHCRRQIHIYTLCIRIHVHTFCMPGLKRVTAHLVQCESQTYCDGLVWQRSNPTNLDSSIVTIYRNFRSDPILILPGKSCHI